MNKFFRDDFFWIFSFHFKETLSANVFASVELNFTVYSTAKNLNDNLYTFLYIQMEASKMREPWNVEAVKWI